MTGVARAAGRPPAGLCVLMTADAVGGVWTYALDLARGLGPCGVRVRLCVLGPEPGPDQRADAAAVPGLDLIETGLPLDWTAARPDEILDAGRAVAGLARETGADLVHLNTPALAAADGFDRPVVAACHSCVATWWAAVRGGPLPADLAWRADLTGRGARAAHLLVAPSAAFSAQTRAAYGLPAPPRVVHNGGRGTLPSAVDGPPSPFVLTAGRLWDEGKNVLTLDRAASRLAGPVLAAGSTTGPNGAAVTLRHARRLGRIAGSDLASLYAGRPVFASLALYEPFGLAVLEAATAGCALVLSDIPTFRELWDGAAAFVPARDDEAAARALDRLLADRRARDALGRAAQDRAARYGVDSMASGTLALYRGALARRTAA